MIAKATVLLDNVEDPPNSGFKRENYALSQSVNVAGTFDACRVIKMSSSNNVL